MRATGGAGASGIPCRGHGPLLQDAQRGDRPKMKAAEAAFKDSVYAWEGGTDTELGWTGAFARCRNPALPRPGAVVATAPDCSAWPDYAAAQKRLQAPPWTENRQSAAISIVYIYRYSKYVQLELLIA